MIFRKQLAASEKEKSRKCIGYSTPYGLKAENASQNKRKIIFVHTKLMNFFEVNFKESFLKKRKHFGKFYRIIFDDKTLLSYSRLSCRKVEKNIKISAKNTKSYLAAKLTSNSI